MLAKNLLEAAGNSSQAANYIEDVFSTYLYTGNGITGQPINNGIDLAGKGGLVWIKNRAAAQNHLLYDTVRGVRNNLQTDNTGAQQTAPAGYDLTAFNSSGFTLGDDYWGTNSSAVGQNFYASWTFREQPKFFDVVTYTGNGTAGRTVSHNLGSVPGCIIIKNYQTAGTSWAVYHRSVGDNNALLLNSTNPSSTYSGAQWWNNTIPTSTQFTVGTNGNVNTAGETYVAYLFAHDAGGFGTAGTDNVVSCGSVSASGVTAVTLGYEPQWLLMKRTDSTAGWFLTDTMRGWSMTSWPFVQPNTSGPEYTGITGNPTATGFTFDSASLSGTGTYIYIAIRRGPMKVPTDGTKVFAPVARTGTGAAVTVTGLGFSPDLAHTKSRSGDETIWFDRLRGAEFLRPSTTGAASANSSILFDVSNAVNLSAAALVNGSGTNYSNYFFQRAPGFFDEVCYTGTGASNRAITHNLSAVPQLAIAKNRSTSAAWPVYHSNFPTTNYLWLNQNYQLDSSPYVWGSSSPTSTNFYVGDDTKTNASGSTYVLYLFATCPGVSKVGSYTGTGATQTIACGFAGGARFVLIKRTDSTGDWYVWDTARGMVSGTDPSLLLNSTAAEVNANSIYTATTGFQIVSTAAGINASGGSYIFLAIA